MEYIDIVRKYTSSSLLLDEIMDFVVMPVIQEFKVDIHFNDSKTGGSVFVGGKKIFIGAVHEDVGECRHCYDASVYVDWKHWYFWLGQECIGVVDIFSNFDDLMLYWHRICAE